MRLASLLLVGVTAIPVTLSAQQIDSNTIESSSQSGRSQGWSGDFTTAGFSGHDGGAPVVYDFARGPDGTLLDRFTIVEDGFNSMVFRIAFPPAGRTDEVIVGGAFTEIGAEAFARIARLRDGRWEPLGSGLPSAVLALAWGRDAVYASTEDRGDPVVEHLLPGRWDGTRWEEVATPENGLPRPREETVHSIRDLLALGRYVVAVGSLWPETGGRNVFIYDDRQRRMAPLGGGLNAISVDAVALGRDGLWFGGEIAEAGSGDTRMPSIGVAHFRLRR